MNDLTHVCKSCGVQLAKKPGPGRWPQRCSECRHPKPRLVVSHEPVQCQICGVMFVAGCKVVTCSRACGMMLRMQNLGTNSRPIVWSECRRCGRACVAKPHKGTLVTRTLVYCSAECRSAQIENRRYETNKPCKSCGVEFRVSQAHWMYCSDACFKLSRANDGRARLAQRRRHYAEHGEPFDRLEVFERDGWVCGICGEAIDRALKWPDHWSATVDHVLPIARGGRHELANVVAAHWWCNSAKRDDPSFSLLSV